MPNFFLEALAPQLAAGASGYAQGQMQGQQFAQQMKLAQLQQDVLKWQMEMQKQKMGGPRNLISTGDGSYTYIQDGQVHTGQSGDRTPLPDPNQFVTINEQDQPAWAAGSGYDRAQKSGILAGPESFGARMVQAAGPPKPMPPDSNERLDEIHRRI